MRYLLRDFLIASIGDSFASGQGNPDLPGRARFPFQCDAATLSQRIDMRISMRQDPVWLEPEASRSLRSGPALAADSLQRKSLHSDGAVVDDLITFVSFARSGAEIFDGLLRPQGRDGDFIGSGQTEEMRRTVSARAVDALLISIGGNDAGFAGVLKDLVAKDFSIWQIGNDAAGREEVIRRTERRLGVGLMPPNRGEVEIAFDALGNEIDALRQQIPIREIYITGYPTGLFETRNEQGQISTRVCGIFSGPDLDITPADAREISRMGGLLNDLIRRKAQEFGWHFVDVAEDFRGRGYCAPEVCWVGAEESCNKQGNFEGTMHPNARGHAIYGLRLAEILRRLTINRRRFRIGDAPRPQISDQQIQGL
ncbi:MAG: SGNH/GDSL hydrolase family protein [Actinomycetota bacterium]|nr:SGNH/GDSL hydrolase family protein [Actinomycetota bacterium]